MSQNDIQRNKLLRLGIFELRNMARDIGVRSPTTLTKDVMVSEMLRVVRGEVDPYVPPSKRGRPPKSNYKDSAYSMEPVGVSLLREGLVTLDNIDSGSDLDITGFIDNRSEEAYMRSAVVGNFYSSKGICRISHEQLSRHGLSLGDKIAGMAKNSSMADMPVVVKVEEINGKPPAEHNRNVFDELGIKPLNVPLQLPGLKTHVGSRVIGFYHKTDESFAKFVDDAGKDGGFAKICVGIDCFPEEIIVCSSLKNAECFYTTAEQPSHEHLGLIEFAISRAKNLACEKKNVLLIVDGIDKIVRNQNLESGKHIYDISSLSISKKLLATARQLEEGSVTVLALCQKKEGNEFLETLKNSLDTMMMTDTVNVN